MNTLDLSAAWIQAATIRRLFVLHDGTVMADLGTDTTSWGPARLDCVLPEGDLRRRLENKARALRELEDNLTLLRLACQRHGGKWTERIPKGVIRRVRLDLGDGSLQEVDEEPSGELTWEVLELVVWHTLLELQGEIDRDLAVINKARRAGCDN